MYSGSVQNLVSTTFINLLLNILDSFYLSCVILQLCMYAFSKQMSEKYVRFN